MCVDTARAQLRLLTSPPARLKGEGRPQGPHECRMAGPRHACRPVTAQCQLQNIFSTLPSSCDRHYRRRRWPGKLTVDGGGSRRQGGG